MVRALHGKSQLTVCVPTNEFCMLLHKGTVATMLKHENNDNLT